MSYSFCTLFDIGYLARGLLMIRSLVRHNSEYKVYVLAMDKESEAILIQLQEPGVVVIKLEDFEDQVLKQVKVQRTRVEYYWTCTASLIRYCLLKLKLINCTYLDADLYFYKDPMPQLALMNQDSVLLTEHHYTKRYDQSEKSGKYCVQFMFFKNNEDGLKALQWWRDRCLEWCFARHEEGKFGDQKYLDDWLTRFKGVRVCPDPGYGVAPWNVQRYSQKWLSENMVFFHFHGVRFIKNNTAKLESYYLGTKVISLVFLPYLHELLKTIIELEKYIDLKKIHPIQNVKKNVRFLIAQVWHRFRGTWNEVKLKGF